MKLPPGITLVLELVQRPGPLSNNTFQMAIGALRGHWSFLDGQRGTVLLEGYFPTTQPDIERLEALCKACADFGCTAEMRMGHTHGTIIEMSALES